MDATDRHPYSDADAIYDVGRVLAMVRDRVDPQAEVLLATVQEWLAAGRSQPPVPAEIDHETRPLGDFPPLGWVRDAGGGEVQIVVSRDLWDYPEVGTPVYADATFAPAPVALDFYGLEVFTHTGRPTEATP